MAYPTLSPPAGVNIAQGSGVSFEPRVNKATFGDGYAQRSADGLNSNPAVLEASFEVLLASEADALLDFFAERGGYKPFMFTLPEASSPRQWIAPRWKLTYTGKKIRDVSVTLEENFDP